jgi:2-C-methyl-D-erythritol 2,4-cyclodiphosphate synthase
VIRVGNGLDVHAFEHGVPLWLGGIRIPHDRGLAGHSDGDAAVHALIDALLGATNRGDIGQWFPSTDNTFRGARGVDLLRHVWQSLAQDGWVLENADLTIVCQEPRLTPHRAAMVRALSTALGCAPEAISLKATTTDKLGFVGRAEGVLAIATVLIST